MLMNFQNSLLCKNFNFSLWKHGLDVVAVRKKNPVYDT